MCECSSMIPGDTNLPAASTTSVPGGTSTAAPTAAIRPPRISTVPFAIVPPVTVRTVPPLIAIAAGGAVAAPGGRLLPAWPSTGEPASASAPASARAQSAGTMYRIRCGFTVPPASVAMGSDGAAEGAAGAPDYTPRQGSETCWVDSGSPGLLPGRPEVQPHRARGQDPRDLVGRLAVLGGVAAKNRVRVRRVEDVYRRRERERPRRDVALEAPVNRADGGVAPRPVAFHEVRWRTRASRGSGSSPRGHGPGRPGP